MKKTFLVSFFSGACLLALTGCTTVEFVRKDTKPVKQAVIRYAPQSNPDKEAKYREEFKKQASGFCGGEFDITKEYQAREETGSSTGVGTGFGTGMGVGVGGIFLGGSSRNTAMYQFIEFACK